ncbi:MAG: hypothetical protein U5L09_00655 [Bacteroidales bacterium]|nr:hypothetical protein [Bacteroidales bacterium]
MTVPNVIGLTADERTNNIWYQNLSNHLVTARGNTFSGNSKLSTRVSYQNNHRMLRIIDATAVDMVMSNLSFDSQISFPFAGRRCLPCRNPGGL